MSARTMCRFLFIGYGNDLRCDDGAGQHAARIIEKWGMAGMRVIATHQLLPELSEEIAWARCVIFADSYAANPGDGCRISTVVANKPIAGVTHSVSPHALLWYAQDMYDRKPTAWVIGIPSVDFGHGEELSPTAQAGVREAVARVREIVESEGGRYGSTKACTKSA
jgi:hydrogenase maturation protease